MSPFVLDHAYKHNLMAMILLLGQPSLLASLYYQLTLKLFIMYYRLYELCLEAQW